MNSKDKLISELEQKIKEEQMNNKDKLISELEQKIKEEQENIEKLKKENDEWFPREGEEFYVVNGGFGVNRYYHLPKQNDPMYNAECCGKVFKTSEEAELEKYRLNKLNAIHYQLRLLSDKSMKGVDRLDTNTIKYYIECDVLNDLFYVKPCDTFCCSDVLFATEDEGRKAIKEIGEDDLKFYFGIDK